MPATPNFTFYTRASYQADLLERLSRATAGDSVAVATMSFRPENPGIKPILDELAAAARRGASVQFFMDAYPFLIQNGSKLGPLFYHGQLPSRLPASFRPVLSALERLREAGVRCAITNQPSRPFSNPIAGRSHIKFALINDRVYVGGSNLDNNSHTDIMIGWDDQPTADWLRALAAKFTATGNVRTALHSQDQTHSLNPTTSLLVDSGVPNQSLIFDQALALIDAAREHVLITCQYFPNNVTARHLQAAHRRGVKVEIQYNHPSKHHQPNNLLHHGVVLSERSHLPRSFFAHVLPKNANYLHAKVIATESGAIVGSHNYVRAGVQLGTAEIALLVHDPQFARQAVATIRQQTGEPALI